MSTEELINENIKLVYLAARRRKAKIRYGIELDELISYGTFGLIDAANKYNPERNIRFTTYAYYRINGAITDGLRERFYICNAKEQGSLEEKHADDDDDSENEIPSPYQYEVWNNVENELLRERLLAEIQKLSERERLIIIKNDLQGRTQEEIGKELGISSTWVCVIRSKALKKLRENLQDMKDFVAS